MKTKMVKIFVFTLIALGVNIFQIQAQSTITYGSGTMTNNATTPAGTVGAYSTFIGNGAGSSNTSSGLYNSAFGSNALTSNTAGDYNTALGFYTFISCVYGNRGTAIGAYSQRYANSTGSSWINYNISLGYEALRGSPTAANNTGNYNLAFGYQSMLGNTSGSNNVATGYLSLYSNTIGGSNTAIGNNSMYSNVAGSRATAIGYNALYYTNSTSTAFDNYNVAVGYEALRGSTTAANNTGNNNSVFGSFALQNNTSGSYNTALGTNALFSNTAGSSATAIVYNAMYYSNSYGSAFTNYNVAVGYEALRGSTTAAYNTGNYNTSLGYQTLYSNTEGQNNTATGFKSLYTNTTGYGLTANGFSALYSNTYGTYNSAIGYLSLYNNTTGSLNSANGSYALYSNESGNDNTANGFHALYSNLTGYENTANGSYALSNNTGTDNTAIGFGTLYSNTSGSANTALGAGAFSNGNYSGAAAIGYNAATNANNKIYIGTSANSGNVGGYDGWQQFSDRRFKHNVSEDIPGILFIKKLRPVSYQVKVEEYDMFFGIKQRMDTIQDTEQRNRYYQRLNEVSQEKKTGFIAQEVDSVANLLGYNFDGVHIPVSDQDNYSICYSSFVVPLVKAVQELSKTLDSLKNHQATIDSLLISLQNGSLPGGKILQNNYNKENGKTGTTIQVELESNSNVILYQNEPNPFDENTIIRYFVPDDAVGNVFIVFYDMYGKELIKVDIETKGFGRIDAGTGNLAAGVYSYSIIVNDMLIDTKKMLKSKWFF